MDMFALIVVPRVHIDVVSILLYLEGSRCFLHFLLGLRFRSENASYHCFILRTASTLL